MLHQNTSRLFETRTLDALPINDGVKLALDLAD